MCWLFFLFFGQDKNLRAMNHQQGLSSRPRTMKTQEPNIKETIQEQPQQHQQGRIQLFISELMLVIQSFQQFVQTTMNTTTQDTHEGVQKCISRLDIIVTLIEDLQIQQYPTLTSPFRIVRQALVDLQFYVSQQKLQAS
jgi:molecular chaperone GrpE (heat shock protein)